MALVRMLVTWGRTDYPVRDWMSNTLYFNVSGSLDAPGYQGLADDLRTIYAARSWTKGLRVQVRAYDMADAEPRPEHAFSQVDVTGTQVASAHQVALCLSYYADRNLPRHRGRIYTGPWNNGDPFAPTTAMAELITFGQALAGLGGLNVDWSIYSPTTAQGGGSGATRISNIWADNSWDVVRSRKLKSTTRQAATING